MKKIIKRLSVLFVAGIISTSMISCDTDQVSNEVDTPVSLDLSKEDLTTFSGNTTVIARYKGKEYLTERRDGEFLNEELVSALPEQYMPYVVHEERRMYLFDTYQDFQSFKQRNIEKNNCSFGWIEVQFFDKENDQDPSLVHRVEDILQQDFVTDRRIKNTEEIFIINNGCVNLDDKLRVGYAAFYGQNNLNEYECNDRFTTDCERSCGACRGAQARLELGESVGIRVKRGITQIEGRFGGMRNRLDKGNINSFKIVVHTD